MAHFLITSKHTNPDFRVWLADCTAEHAETVRAQLEGESVAPDDLVVAEREFLYDEPPTKRPWYRRFF